jgi:CelD/BcsL family acetyltransferase involved in cellulose biosynthesis
MEITLVKPAELTAAHLDAWQAIVPSEELASPFYAAAFTQAISQCRDDVEVSVLEDGGRIVGFFPFQRAARRVGRPVGWKINDFQGAILDPAAQLDAAELLHHSRLSEWRFNHLPLNQTWCERAHVNRADSPYIDVRQGYEAYLQQKRASGSSRLKTALRMVRKFEREVEPLRLEFTASDPAVFQQLLQWKYDQLCQMNTWNPLAQDWVRDALEVLRESGDPDCSGVLSALYSGDVLLAAHFGLYNSRVLHWWIPAYNPAYEKYSPGSILLLKVIEKCAARNLLRIDLGKGSEAYKQSFGTGSITLAEGAIARRAWRQTANSAAFSLIQSVRSTPWARAAVSWIKRVRRHGWST